ncbi:MAG: potassium channel protein [Gloeocapsa sp. DLM2.Bin57]|nr:MAG: potassium channel protein [Gloeocapsa sp. DLM2.Bin57]
MPNSLTRIFIGTIFFIITMIVAVVGYILFGWTTLDSIYMVIITIFGVGYGEVQPLETPAQKVFTILVIIAGTSSAVYSVGGFVQMITEGEINKALNTQRQQKTIDNLSDHIIICGFERMGQILAQQLHKSGEQFIVLDNNPESLTIAESLNYLIKIGDVTDETFLESIGILRAKIIAVVLPDDTANVFITLTARSLNPDLTIIARGDRPSTEKKLLLAGANHIILPASLSALRIANLITHPTALDFLGHKQELNYLNELLGQLNIEMNELLILADSPLIGKTIRELQVRSQGNFIVVALSRSDGELIIPPNPSLILNKGDNLILLGNTGNLNKLELSFALKRKERLYRGVKI